MTEYIDNGLNLGNFVFDGNKRERQSWKCFVQTCNGLRVVFVPIFDILLNALVKVTIVYLHEEKTVWIAVFSSTVGYSLPSGELCT